jgi:PAS domain S-box-containing protein
MTPNYDNAVAKYYNKLRIVPLPLDSWNVFAYTDIEVKKYKNIQKDWREKENPEEILLYSNKHVVVTNAKNEIVFATRSVREMNGYHPFEIIGKSPKMFQGKLTSQKTKDIIRKAIQNHYPFKEVITNYKKDGSTYECVIEAYPKFNKKGEFVNYIAFEKTA